MRKNNSFFEKLGRSLKIEDASLTDYDADQDDMDATEDLNNNELEALDEFGNLPEPDSTEELELDEDMLKEISEEEKSEESDESEEEFDKPIATLAITQTKKIKPKSKSKFMPTAKQNNALDENLGMGRLNIDVYELDDEIVIKSAIAGINEDDLDIEITADTVTIKGERSRDEEVAEENYFYKECYWGAFLRSVRLHAEIDPDKADATMQNGILTIRLPKLSKTNQKKLKVKKLS